MTSTGVTLEKNEGSPASMSGSEAGATIGGAAGERAPKRRRLMFDDEVGFSSARELEARMRELDLHDLDRRIAGAKTVLEARVHDAIGVPAGEGDILRQIALARRSAAATASLIEAAEEAIRLPLYARGPGKELEEGDRLLHEGADKSGRTMATRSRRRSDGNGQAESEDEVHYRHQEESEEGDGDGNPGVPGRGGRVRPRAKYAYQRPRRAVPWTAGGRGAYRRYRYW